MTQGAPRLSNSMDEENLLVCNWLQEAAACLTDPGRCLPPPPSPALQPAYEAVLSSRQQFEQSCQDLIENVQMQSLQMIGSVLAHDLHSLSLRLTLLSQNLERFYGDPAFLQSAKRVLDDTVERMRGLVESFRERQQAIVVKIRTDVNGVLRTLSQQLRLRELPGVELEENYAASTPIWADPFFLTNAFRVLLENALDAMPAGGRLTLRTCSVGGVSPTVEVTVADTGTGMTPEFVERELFMPFRSGKSRGLGLGMYICQQIIHLHDGKISVESEPKRGTTFHLKFPAGPRGE